MVPLSLARSGLDGQAARLIARSRPDFKSFKLDDVGITAKALQLRFVESLFFHQLSDGEKLPVAL